MATPRRMADDVIRFLMEGMLLQNVLSTPLAVGTEAGVRRITYCWYFVKVERVRMEWLLMRGNDTDIFSFV